ncbi:MAG: hypothetical protein MJ076_01675, partial [Clostridia bacterium]|nr:hypothetical protein [Clostridia bacterium]
MRLHTMYAKKRSNSTAVDANASTLNTPKANRENASNNSIPTQSENVKESFSLDNESVRQKDAEYLELAKNPEENEARLRELVDEAAKTNGYIIHKYISGDIY